MLFSHPSVLCFAFFAVQCCLVAFFDCDESDDAAVSFVSAMKGRVILVNTRRVQLATHEADRVFPDNHEMAIRAGKGEYRIAGYFLGFLVCRPARSHFPAKTWPYFNQFF